MKSPPAGASAPYESTIQIPSATPSKGLATKALPASQKPRP